MRIEIRILSGGRQGDRLELDAQKVDVGSDEGCEVRFDHNRDPAAHGRRLRLRCLDDGWRIMPLVGTVWLNHNPLREGEQRIRSGDVVRLSESGPEFCFTILGSSTEPAAAARGQHSRAPDSRAPLAPGFASAGRTFPGPSADPIEPVPDPFEPRVLSRADISPPSIHPVEPPTEPSTGALGAAQRAVAPLPPSPGHGATAPAPVSPGPFRQLMPAALLGAGLVIAGMVAASILMRRERDEGSGDRKAALQDASDSSTPAEKAASSAPAGQRPRPRGNRVQQPDARPAAVADADAAPGLDQKTPPKTARPGAENRTPAEKATQPDADIAPEGGLVLLIVRCRPASGTVPEIRYAAASVVKAGKRKMLLTNGMLAAEAARDAFEILAVAPSQSGRKAEPLAVDEILVHRGLVMAAKLESGHGQFDLALLSVQGSLPSAVPIAASDDLKALDVGTMLRTWVVAPNPDDGGGAASNNAAGAESTLAPRFVEAQILERDPPVKSTVLKSTTAVLAASAPVGLYLPGTPMTDDRGNLVAVCRMAPKEMAGQPSACFATLVSQDVVESLVDDGGYWQTVPWKPSEFRPAAGPRDQQRPVPAP